MKLTQNELLHRALGRSIKVIKHKPTKHTKFYKRDLSDSEQQFTHEKIDTQKAINSEHETTLDYLLKHDKTNPQIKQTLGRLRSLNKGNKTGILYDSTGREVITTKKAQENKKALENEIAKLKVEKDNLLKKHNAGEPDNKKPTTPVVENKGDSNESK